MPPNQETPNPSDPSVQKQMRYGALLLCLIAAASGFFVFDYLNTMQPPVPIVQAAAVALVDPFESVSIAGKSAVVIDLTTGETLYEKNADSQLPLASITKVPLAIVIAESMDKNMQVTVPFDSGWNSNAQQLHQGQIIKLQDLIDFTLIASSNEGAEMLSAAAETAVHAKYPQSPMGGATLWRMNNIVSELGLHNTYFLNVSGLDESATQSGSYGSARDVAKIFAYASAHYPDTFAGTAENGRLIGEENGSVTSVTNTNEALHDIPGIIMGKTGFTDLAGGNLAVVFDIGLAHPVVAVVLGSTREARFSDMKRLVDKSRAAVMQQP